MKLRQLIQQIPDIEVKGSKDITISSIANHSQAVGPGSIFIARRGKVFDANRFVPEAVSAGAVCIVSDTFDPSLKGITQIITPEIARVEAALAHAFWEDPSQSLPVIGITGTSGKTTTSYLIRHMLESLQKPCGIIGTIEYAYGSTQREATHTSPDAVTIIKLLAQMKQAGMKACVMEVTSHACMQKRVEGIHFQGGIYTNLSHEHLDYHGTMQEYALAKQLFFKQLDQQGSSIYRAPFAVVNKDDAYAQMMIDGFKGEVSTFSIEDPTADFFADSISFTHDNMTFQLRAFGRSYPVTTHLVGRFNVLNILSSLSMVSMLGLNVEKAIASLQTFLGAPGRLERVLNQLGISVLVDFAHKEDALRKILLSLRETTKGRILTVFGCGGDRDRTKRPLMAKAAQELSDAVIVTLDNPRSEDPDEILNEICRGFTSAEKWSCIKDRREAIFKACCLARPGDVVLLAGKGHEKYQLFHDGKVPFDDREVAAKACFEIANSLADTTL